MTKNIKKKFRDITPIQLYLLVGCVYWCLSPNKTSKIILQSNECFLCYNLSLREKYFIPDLDHQRRASTRKKNKLDKYTSNGFVEVEPGDTIVDVGAFVGEFSLPASRIANKTISIEPAPKNYKCLKKNTNNHDIQTVQAIVSTSDMSGMLNIGEDPSDHSIMNVDAGEIKNRVDIDSVRLDNLLKDLCEDHIDFLKVDAEGAEPEVLRSASDIDIKKVAVDCSPERNGETTIEEVTEILEKQGFDVEIGSSNKHIVFGARKNVNSGA